MAYSARAQWNTANARLANKPFDDLFTPKSQIQLISSPNELDGSGWYDCKQFDSEEAARAAGISGLLYKSQVLPAWYLFVKVAEEPQS